MPLFVSASESQIVESALSFRQLSWFLQKLFVLSSSSPGSRREIDVSGKDDGTPAQMMIGFSWGKSTPDMNFDAHMSVDKELAQCGVLCVVSWKVQVAWQGGGGGDYDNEAEAKPTQNFIEAHGVFEYLCSCVFTTSLKDTKQILLNLVKNQLTSAGFEYANFRL
uniref:Uncharacterized protein n=1 Tax=Timema douglasi TaxID=61478 RepID=A0A7R8VNA6_TIMDO|nr:unnamed protein product [Timema douglasi]